MKKVSILGSTGSIGTQTIEVVRDLEDIEIVGLSAGSNIDLLESQISQLKPRLAAVMDATKAEELRQRLATAGNDTTEVLSGMDGLIQIAIMEEVDMVVTSVVGMIGLKPTVEAIKKGKDIALANKETLVTAGELIMKMAKNYNINIYPVDSEHSAIFQCLQGNKSEYVEKIILTASGGPFRGKTRDYLETVSLEQALNHPNWSMGHKITIDSATLMNKGLEVIEAKWLFDLEIEDIDVVVHPQSIIHSMVQYRDGSYIAQMGQPDMKVPIQYALTYPERKDSTFPRLDFGQLKQLTFETPDMDTFRCLKLSFEAMKIGGTMPTVLNAANEEAVALFLNKKIQFLQIPEIIEEAMEAHEVKELTSIDDVLDTEVWTREFVRGRGHN